jgi:hypothetical protein
MIATHPALLNTTEQQMSFRSGLLWPDDNGIHINAHIWLPIEFQDGVPVIKWHDKWDLSIFNSKL